MSKAEMNKPITMRGEKGEKIQCREKPYLQELHDDSATQKSAYMMVKKNQQQEKKKCDN